jgi:hypothetical protein
MQLEFPPIRVASSYPDWDSLTRLLGELSLDRQILFAASICERTLPIYVSIEFPEDFNHKTLPILREIMNYIWDFPAAGIFNRESLQNLLVTCRQITSKIEANDLCCTVHSNAPYLISHTLELCLTGEVKYLKEVFSSGHDMLWELVRCCWVQEGEMCGEDMGNKSSEEEDGAIDNDEDTQREMQKERADWQVLANTPEISAEFIQQFRHAANPNGYGTIEFE